MRGQINREQLYKDIQGYIKNSSSISASFSPALGTSDHTKLINRYKENQHPISAIIGLQDELNKKLEKVVFNYGTKTYLENTTFILSTGEPIFEIDTGQMKIGNGIDIYKSLPYVGETSFNNLFNYETDSLINKKVYHILWTEKPTSSNLLYGFSVDPENGKTVQITNNYGDLELNYLINDNNTISNSEIDNLFN